MKLTPILVSHGPLDRLRRSDARIPQVGTPARAKHALTDPASVLSRPTDAMPTSSSIKVLLADDGARRTPPRRRSPMSTARARDLPDQ